MAPKPDFQATMDAIDVATTKLGVGVSEVSTALGGASTRVAALTDKISTSMSAEDVASVKATLESETTKIDSAADSLNAIASTLTGIAADPANPVPPTV